MRILFEGHKYPQNLLEPYIKGLRLDNIRVKNDAVSLSYVGYFYCDTEDINDIVFILPKVFIYNDNYESEPEEEGGKTTKYRAFGKFEPEKIIKADDSVFKAEDDSLGKYYHDYIFKLSAWLYQTIRQYNKRVQDNDNCVRDVSHSLIGKKGNSRTSTLMDRIFSLRKFVADNPAFFTFVLKNAHSGYNKINWNKTISKQQPVIVKGNPIYINAENRKRFINDEEELLVILFSTLNDIHKTYGIPVSINEQFKLLSNSDMKSFKKNASRKLRSLKYKYFSDKALELWNLLFDFYDKQDLTANTRKDKDILLVKSFNPVFEDMLDYLLSDDNYPKELKDQTDGKFIDHIYRNKSLVYDDDIFYVGDSKYYKEDRKLEDKSVAKQYTYAKNVIQRNIDVIKGYNSAFGPASSRNEDYANYRDDLTEGYNITPNFFISGVLSIKDKKFDDSELNLEGINADQKANGKSQHFPNRLFDRDTLLLQRYNVNFLYVLFIYARNAKSKRDIARSEARKIFKKDIQKNLSNNYNFYHFTELKEKSAIEKFLDLNFRKLNGKVFSFPSSSKEQEIYLLMALELGSEEIKVEDGYVKGLNGDETYKVEQIWLQYEGGPTNKQQQTTIEENKIVGQELQQTEQDLNIPLQGCTIAGQSPQNAGQTQQAPTIGNTVVGQGQQLNQQVTVQDYWPIESEIDDHLKYRSYLPLFSIKAACGLFTEYAGDVEIKGWIKIEGKALSENMFIVEAVGDSMEPSIYEGDYCVFQANPGGSKNYDIVLAERFEQGISNDERYIIKKYHSEKIEDPETHNQRHSKIEFISLNQKYNPIILEGDNLDEQTKVHATLIRVLHRHSAEV